MSDARVFNGRYEFVRKIARGGMAEVFLARDQLLDRPVALKMLFPELSTDRNFVERFRREAQAAANLTHPNVVSVYDWGEEGSTYFIVMEFVEGRTLSEIVRGDGPMAPDRAADVAADVAAALGFAHSNGVVHRDVKPGNVLISNNGHVKVTDFGIARALDSKENLTQTGAVMGTATYFSPEQAQGHSIDARSDVYSLGVVLYEMLTGAPPFTGDNPVAIAGKHVREAAVLPTQRNPSIPAALESIVMMAMAKDPNDRYNSAEDMRADLERFRHGQRVAAAAVSNATVAMAPVVAATTLQAAYGTGQGTQMYTGPLTGPVTGAVAEQPGRRTDTYVIVLLLLLALLGGLLYFAGRELGLFGGDTNETVAVVNVVGKQAEEGTRLLEEQGLRSEITEVESDAEKGLIVAQDPGGNEKVPKDSVVKLDVSTGKKTIPVPDVIGEPVGEATKTLQDAGFEVETTEEASDEKVGTVLAQDPFGGEKVAEGETVSLTVSSGPGQISVPNVVGQTEDNAADKLEAAGFQQKVEFEPSASVPDGRVIRTDPPAGTKLSKGDTVTMVISTGPPATTSAPPVVTTSPPSDGGGGGGGSGGGGSP